MSAQIELENAVCQARLDLLKELCISVEQTNYSIVLACKHNKIKILKYLLNSAYKDLVPKFEDSTQHNAFYYAIRSGNAELLDTLISKWPNNYFTNNFNELDEIISLAYDELRLKNIPLSDEMWTFVESQLLELRFYTDHQNKNVRTSHDDINHRIELVIDNITLLNKEYKNHKEINERFLFIGKFIAQNIYILKRQLKSTYKNLPWEEIEFCLICFISVHLKHQEFNIFVQAEFDKIKILNHLENFANKLKNEQNKINQISINKLRELPNLSREGVIDNILKNGPEFESLYENYQQIRDMHSLMKLNDSIELAMSADSKDREGQLIIIRVIQIIGEYFKNTLESPKLSKATNEILLLFLPTNTRKIITNLRNSISHAYSLSNRISIEAIKDMQFFIGIQNDLKKIRDITTNILYKNKMKTIEIFLNKILNSKDLNEIKNHSGVFNKLNFNFFFKNSSTIMNESKVEQLIKKLDNILPEKTNYEKELFSKINTLIELEKDKFNEIRNKYAMAVLSIVSLNDVCQEINNNQNTLRVMKYNVTKALERVTLSNEFSDFKELFHLITKLINSLQSKMQADNLYELKRIFCEVYVITYYVQRENIKWIEDLKEKLNEKQTYIPKKRNNFDNHLKQKLTDLRIILSNNKKNCDDLALYRENKKLQAIVEMFLLDIMSILGIKNSLQDDLLFLDDNSPLLIGKGLRNHLAHDNVLVDQLLTDPSISLLLNAKKLVKDDIINNKKKIGKSLNNDISKLEYKFQENLIKMEVQGEMFLALENGNLEEVKNCMYKGADINARNKDMSTALHLAAKGNNVELIKFLLDQNLNINVKNFNNESPLHIAVTNGRADIVKYLIEKLHFNIDEVGNNGKRPLHIAAKHGHKDVVRILLKNKANTSKKDNRGYAALHYAAENNHKEIFKILLAKETNVDSNETRGGYTTLHIVAENGFLDLVNILLENNATVDAKNDDGGIPLHLTVLNGHLEVVKVLISNGADVNARDLIGSTPLHYAMEGGHAHVADILLKHGSNVNAIDKMYHNTPLHYATKDGHIDIVINLLKYKANANAANIEGGTPLHFAIKSGHLDIVAILLKHGVDIHAKDINNHTPLHYAADNGHKDVTEILLKNKANVDALDNCKSTPLHLAASKANINVIELLIKNNANISAQDTYGNTPMHIAAKNGNINVIDIFIKKKADVEAKNSLGLTPLHLACVNGNTEALVFLLKNHANANSKADFDFTPLFSAISEGHIDCVTILIESKAEINLTNKLNKTPLQLAIERGHKDIVSVLIKNGANINAINNAKTPLEWAIRSNNIDIVKILIANGADVNIGMTLYEAVYPGYRDIVGILLKNKARSTDEKGVTLLHLAVIQGHNGIVKDLIAQGADVNAKTPDFITPLHMAAQKGHVDVIETLLQSGADVNTINLESAAIHIAAGQGYKNVIESLLDNGAEINLKDRENRTAFEIAIAHGHLSVVQALFERNEVDVNAKGNDNWTIFHTAAQCGHLEITKFLIEKGADINASTSTGAKAIHIAARDGRQNIVDFFINQGLSIHDLGAASQSPLHYTALTGQTKIAEYLLEKGANVNLKDANGHTPIFLAARFGFKDFTSFLLQHGAMYNAVDNNKKIPLQLTKTEDIKTLLQLMKQLFDAVKNNDVSQVRNSIKAGAIVNAQNVSGVTALHFAAWKGYNEIVNILLENEAKTNTCCPKGFTPLHYAAKFSHINVVNTLISNGAVYNPVSIDGKTPFDLASDDDIKNLLKLIHDIFRKVEDNNCQVVNTLERIKDSNTRKCVIRAHNRENKTLIVTAMHSRFSKIEDLKEIYQPNLSSQMHNALEFIKKSQYEEALRIYESVYEKRKGLFGSYNPATFDVEINIAKLVNAQGNYSQCMSKLEDIKRRQEKVLGLNYKDTLYTRAYIAILVNIFMSNDEGLQIFEEIYDKLKEQVAPNDSELIKTQFYMASLLTAAEKKYDEALKMNLELYKQSATLDRYRLYAVDAQCNIAVLLRSVGKFDEALEMYKEVYEKRKVIFGIHHRDTLRTLCLIAWILYEQNKDNEAMQIYQWVLSVMKNQQEGPNRLETLYYQYVVGHIYYNQGKINSALESFNECHDQIKVFFGPNNVLVQDMSIKKKNMYKAIQFSGRNTAEILSYMQEGDNSTLKGGRSIPSLSEIVQNLEKNKAFNPPNILGKLPNFPDGQALSYIQQELQNDPSEISEVLQRLEKGESIDSILESSTKTATTIPRQHQGDISKAASDGDLETVEFLLKNGTNPNKKDTEGRTPLHFAISNRHVNIVKFLIENGADITQVTNKGNTTLHTAVSRDSADIADILLQNIGRNKLNEFINANTTASGTTSLHIASKNGSVDLTNLLLQRGAIFNIKNYKGETPFDVSSNSIIRNILKLVGDLFKDVQNGNMEIGNKLKALKPNELLVVTNARNNQEVTLLQVATINKNRQITAQILQAINVTSKIKDTKTEEEDIRTAVITGNIKTVEHLLTTRNKANVKDPDGRTPLHYAISCGHVDIVKLLLKNGADATQVTNKGNTPLHTAVSKNNSEIVEILLKHICPNKLNEFVNAKTTASGTTSLHIAAKNGYFDVVKSLLERGAIYNVENNEGKTPLAVCTNTRINDLLKLIEEMFKEAQGGSIEKMGIKLKAVRQDEFLAVINARNREGLTVQSIAMRCGKQ